MSAITLQVPDDLADRLQRQRERLPEILELGLRELYATAQSGFAGAAEILELLAGLPSPKEILELRPSEALQKRVQELLEKSRAGALTPPEEEEFESYQYLEHLVRIAKTTARQKLGLQPGNG